MVVRLPPAIAEINLDMKTIQGSCFDCHICIVADISTYSHTGLLWYWVLYHRTVDSTAVRNVILQYYTLYHETVYSRQYTVHDTWILTQHAFVMKHETQTTTFDSC